MLIMIEKQYPKPLGGYADPKGFRLWIRFSPDETHVLRFTKGEARLFRKPRKNSIFNRLTSKVDAVLLYYFVLALYVLLTGEKKYEPKIGILGPIMFYFGVVIVQMFGIASWHALEHKSLHVLKWYYKGKINRSFDSLRQALNDAPAIHPRCGSGIVLWATLLLIFSSLVLPANVALATALLGGYFLFDRGIALDVVLPLQNAFLAQPTREQLDAVAQRLFWYLEETEQRLGEAEARSGVLVDKQEGRGA